MNKERVLIIKLSEIKNETGWLKNVFQVLGVLTLTQ